MTDFCEVVISDRRVFVARPSLKSQSYLEKMLGELSTEAAARDWRQDECRRCVLVQQKAMQDGDSRMQNSDIVAIANDRERFADFFAQDIVANNLRGKRLLDERLEDAKPFTPGLLCVAPMSRSK